MTNEEIIIKEHFKVDDSHSKVRGFVFAYDDDDNLVFAKENMIVKSGRRFIMNKGIQEGCFSAAFLSENTNIASEDDTKTGIFRAENLNNVPDLTNDNFETWKVTENILDDNKNYFSYFIDRDNLVIKCMIIFNNSESIKASSLGLISNYEDPSYIKTKDSSKDSDKIYYTFDGTDYTQYSGSEFEDGVDYYEKNEVLFSRLTFPTYYKSPTQRLTFRYYIYF